MIQNHYEGILNYLTYEVTNARVEGKNNKAKIFKRSRSSFIIIIICQGVGRKATVSVHFHPQERSLLYRDVLH